MIAFALEQIAMSFPSIDKIFGRLTGRSKVGAAVFLDSYSNKQAFAKKITHLGVHSGRLLLGADHKGEAVLVSITEPLGLMGYAGAPKSALLNLFAFQYGSLGFPVMYLDCDGYGDGTRCPSRMLKGFGLPLLELEIEHRGPHNARFVSGDLPFEQTVSDRYGTPACATWMPQTQSWEVSNGEICSLGYALKDFLIQRSKHKTEGFLGLPPLLLVLGGAHMVASSLGDDFMAEITRLAAEANVRFIYELQDIHPKVGASSKFNFGGLCVFDTGFLAGLDGFPNVVRYLPAEKVDFVHLSDCDFNTLGRPVKIPYTLI